MSDTFPLWSVISQCICSILRDLVQLGLNSRLPVHSTTAKRGCLFYTTGDRETRFLPITVTEHPINHYRRSPRKLKLFKINKDLLLGRKASIGYDYPFSLLIVNTICPRHFSDASEIHKRDWFIYKKVNRCHKNSAQKSINCCIRKFRVAAQFFHDSF